ncbi:hypothetical protein NMG60_11030108 [Bertholletia excelsa]
MAFHGDEDDVWKCLKHPSRRRRSGICPVCLRDRLISLCPECASALPCACSVNATSSSSSSASSSSSLFSSAAGDGPIPAGVGLGAIGRVSNLIESEPAFGRSRSLVIPFLRSGLAGDGDAAGDTPPTDGYRNRSWIWSAFPSRRKNKGREEGEEAKTSEIYDVGQLMIRSRSVVDDVRSSPAKSTRWHFPSPMKIFRSSKASRILQERSPLHRG